MSTAASFAAIVAGKQAQYIRRFREVKATDEASAVSLEVLGCRDSPIFHSLVSSGMIKEVAGARYYLDLETADASVARRRMSIVSLLLLVVVVVLIIRWVR